MGNTFSQNGESSSRGKRSQLDNEPNINGAKQTFSNDSLAETAGVTNFKWLEGRKYHDVEGVAYILPQDDQEMDRLTLQHHIQKHVFHGNYMPPVQELFSQGAKILDIGCGTGVWLLETASEYPASECVGIDLAKVFPAEIKQKNCAFHIGNVLEGLPFRDNEFDFVQMRLLVLALRKSEWPQVVKEIVRVIKPGGYVQLMEVDMQVWSAGDASPFFERIRMALYAHGKDPLVSRRLPSILAHAGVKDISRRFVSIPIGWGGRVGEMMLENFKSLLKGMYGNLPAIFGQTAKEFDQDCQIAVATMVQSKAYYNWHVAWGKKPLEVNVAAESA